MPPAYAAERLVAAHSEVKRACDLLIAASPEAWEGCHAALERAVFELGDFQVQARRIHPEAGVRSLACNLRAEVLRASQLLQALWNFYRGWERILGAMSAGYTAGGNPAPVARHGRLCCRG
jgi:hypothetical protein